MRFYSVNRVYGIAVDDETEAEVVALIEANGEDPDNDYIFLEALDPDYDYCLDYEEVHRS